ncbi:hypothetical protein [Staphylococcus coagulans]|uniref:hypothetical protein n=1 Tax=Staphylococcus coagulans TaxID=74706 RepID=UPI0030EBD9F0
MDKARIIKGLIIALLLGVFFFVINVNQYGVSPIALATKSIMVAVVFAVLYILTFSILSSDERKQLFGPPLLIELIIGLLAGILFNQPLIGCLTGIVLGIAVGWIRYRMQRRD